MSAASRRWSLLLALGLTLPALSGCLTGTPGSGSMQFAEGQTPPWKGIGITYTRPSSPGDPPFPDDPWSGLTWWLDGWEIYEERGRDDARLMREFAGDEANVTIFLEFPLYLADNSKYGHDPVERLDSVIWNLREEGFRAVLVFSHPAMNARMGMTDPVGSSGDLRVMMDHVGRVLKWGSIARNVDAVSTGYLGGGAGHAEWEVLSYHRAVKAGVNLYGLPYYVTLLPQWLDLDLSQNGYTPASVSREHAAADGIILRATAHPDLGKSISTLIKDAQPRDRIWLVEDVPNCDLNARVPEHDLPCGRQRIQEDVMFWTRAALLAGIHHVGVGTWSDGGGDVLPKRGILGNGGDEWTVKGSVLHDLFVGAHDSDYEPPNRETEPE